MVEQHFDGGGEGRDARAGTCFGVGGSVGGFVRSVGCGGGGGCVEEDEVGLQGGVGRWWWRGGGVEGGWEELGEGDGGRG